MHVYLLRTKLKILSLDSFLGYRVQDSRIIINNRTIATVRYKTAYWTDITIYLKPIDSSTEAIRLGSGFRSFKLDLIYALLASGYRGIPSQSSGGVVALLPCPLGTFSNSSAKGLFRCTTCPPGGFYSDDVGYVATRCKKCPNGSFVHFDKTPGTRKQDCKSCPEGTDTDFFAGYRACKCLKGFYRTHMFEECHKCLQGLKCKDDYASLKSGYWWKWRNDTQKDRYRDFIANLLTSFPALDASSVQYPFPLPTPYKCPREESCKGDLDSLCENGYQGPLCGVCSSGYYKQFKTCTKCPSRKWIVGQLSIIAAIAIIVAVVLVWMSKRREKDTVKRAMIDVMLSKLKIVIGFYQVTCGLLQAFSYIKWPGSLQVIAKYSEILQMDVLRIAPIDCLSSLFHVNAFGSLLAMLAINAAVIGFSVVAYGVRKVTILLNVKLQNGEKSDKISETKELVYRNLFFFLYVTYLSTCSKTVNVLPLACQKLCQDEKEDLCNKYMKADYSIKCQGTKYNYWLIIAYISTAYIVNLPATSFIVLWRKRRIMLARTDAGISKDANCNVEVISGLRFLFENYKTRSWYWELVEMSRKVILTSGLILVGQESRSYIGLGWVIAGMYGILFSWIKPIRDVTENRLMTISLAVTVVNLGIGAVSRIPAENIAASIDTYTDAVLFKILVLGANTLVIGLIFVQYAVFLYRYLKKWRKNPHCSVSCCLALILPLNDLQGEISGLAGANVLNDQLQSGQIDKPCIFSALNDSGAIIDVSSDDNAMEIPEESRQYAKHSNTRVHKGTQTELLSLSITDIVVKRSVKELHRERLSRHSETDAIASEGDWTQTGNGDG
ncbi:cysteine repeat modular protein A-like [Oculina patagonica]